MIANNIDAIRTIIGAGESLGRIVTRATPFITAKNDNKINSRKFQNPLIDASFILCLTLPHKCHLPQKSGSCLKSLSNDATELRAEFADFLLGFPLSLQGSLNALRYLSRLFLILIER